MAHAIRSGRFPRTRRSGRTSPGDASLAPMAQHGLTLLLVVAAVFLAYVASSFVPAPALTLIFVLPVVISGTAFGLGPSITATLTSVLAFDFFFTQPYLTLRMSEPSEIWAAGLLLITAAIVSTVAWQSRQYALQARRAAEQADELRGLAHLVISGASQASIVESAALALNRMFGAPAAIYATTEHMLRLEAQAGEAELGPIEAEAAAGALASGVLTRGRSYPYEKSDYDMWPFTASAERGYVLAVDFTHSLHDRPAEADNLVEIVAGYLAANFAEA